MEIISNKIIRGKDFTLEVNHNGEAVSINGNKISDLTEDQVKEYNWKLNPTLAQQVLSYSKKNDSRKKTIEKSTLSFIGYLMTVGNSATEAKDKMIELSTSVADKIYIYQLGNTSPLMKAVNISPLPFMTSEAKTFLINELTL